MRNLFIFNDAPYGAERPYSGLRLARRWKVSSSARANCSTAWSSACLPAAMCWWKACPG